MEKRLDIPRTNRRMAPKHAATTAVFRDSHELAFGAVINVSMTGACIATVIRLVSGSVVNLEFSFYRQPNLYAIGARVVWNRRGGIGDEGFEGLLLHGVQFTLFSALQKSRLRALLASKDFVDVFRPSLSQFDFLQNALASELDELKMHRTTGEKSKLDH